MALSQLRSCDTGATIRPPAPAIAYELATEGYTESAATARAIWRGDGNVLRLP